ncbi:FAD-dependent oxidoreductase [Streptomyces sp. NPDC048409]|uniref:FAD-dependent oxidoreductase n=1 Tax=Streptomyces sp. NPDC048409 TaxID=3154723 RepID=UPI00342A9024
MSLLQVLRLAGLSMIEAGLVGGECHCRGCVPSTALIRPLDALDAAASIPASAAAVTGSLDVDALFERRDEFVDRWDDAPSAARVSAAGAQLVAGAGGRGERLVEVEHDGVITQVRAGRAAVVATGNVAAQPPVGGLSDVEAWTNREATVVQKVPSSLPVHGGGAMSCELAGVYRGLGARVTAAHRNTGCVRSGTAPFGREPRTWASTRGESQPGRSSPVPRPRAAVILSATHARSPPAPAARSSAPAPRSPRPACALVGQLPLERLRHAVASFLTRSEVWLDLLRAAVDDASTEQA